MTTEPMALTIPTTETEAREYLRWTIMRFAPDGIHPEDDVRTITGLDVTPAEAAHIEAARRAALDLFPTAADYVWELIEGFSE